MKILKFTLVAAAILLLLGMTGCSKKVTNTAPATRETAPVVKPPIAEKPVIVEKAVEPKEKAKPKVELSFSDINFDYDKYDLSIKARQILAVHGELLKENPQVKLKIEGHCDERGTVEYNLALGERRANTVKNYLVNFGIDPSRLSTISYGKERPLDLSSTPEAWSKNRRAAFVITQL